MPVPLVHNIVTRGYSLQLKKERVMARQRSNFRHRVVNRLNILTENMVSASTLNKFKSRLDTF